MSATFDWERTIAEVEESARQLHDAQQARGFPRLPLYLLTLSTHYQPVLDKKIEENDVLRDCCNKLSAAGHTHGWELQGGARLFVEPGDYARALAALGSEKVQDVFWAQRWYNLSQIVKLAPPFSDQYSVAEVVFKP